MGRRRAIFAFPPDVTVVGERDVGVNGVVRDRSHRVGIRFVARARHYPEIAVLRIDCVQASIANLHPGDVITDCRYFPAPEMLGRNEHGEICFAARAGKRGRYVMFATLGRFYAQNQHVLGHPALSARQIRTYPQGETLLAQQNVAAITGADRNDRVVLRKMTDEAALWIYIQQ